MDLERDGRKQFAGIAMFNADGELMARALGVDCDASMSGGVGREPARRTHTPIVLPKAPKRQSGA